MSGTGVKNGAALPRRGGAVPVAAAATAARAIPEGVAPRKVRELVDSPAMVSLAFQPVVDIRQREIVGYEVLARLPGEENPEGWFFDAYEVGLGEDLEMVVLGQVLRRLPHVREGRFLAVNLSRTALCDARVLEMIEGVGSLASRLVVEMSEKVDVPDLDELTDILAPLRRLGVQVALDDAGAGYAGLTEIATLRPDLVKLDRELVTGVHSDPVKRTLAGLVHAHANERGATVVVVGIEHPDDLTAFARGGVRFAQGFLLGRPGPVMAELTPAVYAVLAETADEVPDDIGQLARRPSAVRPWRDGDPLPSAELAHGENRRHLARPVPEHVEVVLDPDGRPVSLELGEGDEARVVPVTLRVKMTTLVVDAARRAMSRPLDSRFDPVVVVDEEQRLLGIFGVSELVLHLSDCLGD